jgi:hypothetical protein
MYQDAHPEIPTRIVVPAGLRIRLSAFRSIALIRLLRVETALESIQVVASEFSA